MSASTDKQAHGLLRDMMKDCEALRDEAKALEVQSTINQDNLVTSLAPFLISLSSDEGHHTTNSSATPKQIPL